MVPTLSVVNIVQTHGAELALSAAGLEKCQGLYDSMIAAISTCEQAGVKLGLGTDILDDRFHALQGGELALRGEVSSPLDVLRSATSVNAEILQKSGELGCVAPGAFADLLVLEGDPLADPPLV